METAAYLIIHIDDCYNLICTECNYTSHNT